MINLNIKQEELTDINLMAGLVNRLLFIKIMSENGNYDKCKENMNFYKGLFPTIKISRENGKFIPRVFNFAKPIVDIATKTFIGEQPDLCTKGKKQEVDKISIFEQKLYKRNFHRELFETGKNCSISGNGLISLFNKENDTFPRFRALNPQFSDVVYDCTLSQDPILAFNIVENIKADYGLIPIENYIVYVYTKTDMFVFETMNRDIAQPKVSQMAKDFVRPMWCWVRPSGEKTNQQPHGYSDIPIIEFKNNSLLSGDFDSVKDLISAYNELQNNRFINVDDIVNYVLLLKNVRIGDKDEQNIMIDMLKNQRILPVEGENVDARFLSNQLDQKALQDLAHDIKQAIDEISRVPNLSGIDFSQNASEPIIKIKTKPLLDLCSEKELYFTPSYFRLIKLVLDFCKENDKKEFSKYDFDLDLCSLEYSHELPSNDLDMITQISNLANAKLINPSEAFKHLSWIPNAQEYIKGMDKYNETLDKKVKEKENNGINDTNIERQKAKLISPKQMDNEHNNANGLANKINEDSK